MFYFFLAVSTALFVSAMCSLLEATLLSLTPSQVAELERRRPRTARIWQRFKLNIEQPIAVILTLNTAAHTIGASVAGAEFERMWGERWLLGFSLLLTYLMLQFTEILPKTLGVTYNRTIAPVIAVPLDALIRVLSPVLWFIHLVNKPFERKGSTQPHGRTLEEINALASMARTANVIDHQQAKLILGASRLPEIRVRQVMTPRLDLAVLNIGDSLPRVLETIRTSGYTRLPLIKGTTDHIIGLVHVRDVLNALKLETSPNVGAFDLLKIKREILFVPSTLFLPQLLRTFQESHTHMAVVVDEYGATEGVVTLEDILEELVGEIEDEFDVPQPPIAAHGRGILVKGTKGLHELKEELGIDIEASDVTTLGGYIMKSLGRFPTVGEVVDLGAYRARVLSIEKRRLGDIELEPVDESKEE